jgi:hypothetical protein
MHVKERYASHVLCILKTLYCINMVTQAHYEILLWVCSFLFVVCYACTTFCFYGKVLYYALISPCSLCAPFLIKLALFYYQRTNTEGQYQYINVVHTASWAFQNTMRNVYVYSICTGYFIRCSLGNTTF